MKNQDSPLTKILQYSITFGACLLVCFIYVLIMGIFNDYQTIVDATHWNINNETAKNLFILTNGFFFTGTICTCIGLFIIATNGGAFEMITYGIMRFISLFKKDPTKVKFKTYYDYHIFRSGEPKHSFFYFIAVGVFYILVSLVLLFFYYQVN